MKARGTSRGMDKREQRGHFFDQTTDAAEVNPPQLATPVCSKYSHGQQQASNHRIYRDLAFITVHSANICSGSVIALWRAWSITRTRFCTSQCSPSAPRQSPAISMCIVPWVSNHVVAVAVQLLSVVSSTRTSPNICPRPWGVLLAND